jgi:hypothetical protein
LRKHLGYSTLLLLLVVSSLFGNDSYLGSRGGSAFLSKTNDIQMTWEIVRIRAERESCSVQCAFSFYNFGPAVKCTVGFPDHFRDPGGGSTPLRGFTCKVNGKNRNVKEMSDSSSDGEIADYWFVWDTEFPSRESVLVENNYSASWGGRVDGSKEFGYVIGTGSSWRNPIGHGRFIFDHTDLATDRFVSLSFTHEGWQVSKSEDSLVVEFSKYTPSRNEQIWFEVLSFWDDPFNNSEVGLSRSLAEYATALKDYVFSDPKKDRQMLQEMINEIYARRGYVFKDSVLDAEYRRKTWYKPDSTFALDRLNGYEKAMIGVIKESLQRPSQ